MFFRIKRLIAWVCSVALVAGYVVSGWDATAAIQPTVGEVETVQGRGWGVGAFGVKYDKQLGDRVVRDEVVATGVNSTMTMRFIDQTSLTLGENAQITVDEMVYDPSDGANDAVTLRLGKGTFYFVSGKVAKDKVTLITPTASIGIRGTELVIKVASNGATSVGVAKGRAFMRSNRDGRSVEIDVGNTARTDGKGRVGQTFPGVDLTGDEDVDRHIPGVSEWFDDEKKEEDEGRKVVDFKGIEHEDEGDNKDGKADGGGRYSRDYEDGEDNEDLDMVAGNDAEHDDADSYDREGQRGGDGGHDGDGGGHDGDGGDGDGGDGGDGGEGDDHGNAGDESGGGDGGKGGGDRDGRDGHGDHDGRH